MIVGDVAGVVVLDVPWLVRVRIPDRGAFAVLVPRALDLVRRRADSPKEAPRELAGRFWPHVRLLLGRRLCGRFARCGRGPERGAGGNQDELAPGRRCGHRPAPCVGEWRRPAGGEQRTPGT